MQDQTDRARRAFLRRVAALGAAAPLTAFALTARPAAAQERAEEGHAQNYVHDATSGVEHPRYRVGSMCKGCAFWRGDDAEWGECAHPQFRGVLVNANGWCANWVRSG